MYVLPARIFVKIFQYKLHSNQNFGNDTTYSQIDKCSMLWLLYIVLFVKMVYQVDRSITKM